MTHDNENKPDARDSATAPTHVEPPKIYLPACGALGDIFWWARRDPSAKDPAPLPVNEEIP